MQIPGSDAGACMSYSYLNVFQPRRPLGLLRIRDCRIFA